MSVLARLTEVGSRLEPLEEKAPPSEHQSQISELAKSARKGDEVSIKALSSFLDSTDEQLRVAALQPLSSAAQRGSKLAMDIITPMLDDASEEVQQIASHALLVCARRGHENIISLMESLQNDSRDSVQRMALEGLAFAATRHGHVGALDALVLRLDHPSPRRRKISIDALVQSSTEKHDTAFAALVKFLDEGNPSELAQFGAVHALASAAREAYEPAIAFFASHITSLPEEARIEATKGLAGAAAGTDEEGGSERAVEILYGLLNDECEEVRFVIFEAFAFCAARGHVQCATFLTTTVERGKLPDRFRLIAMRGLAAAAKRGNDDVVPALFAQLEDPTKEIRKLALLGMQQATDRNSVKALELLLSTAAELEDVPGNTLSAVPEDQEGGKPDPEAEA